MPINDKILKNLPPKPREYWTKAQEFLTTQKVDWEVVEVGTTEFKAWVRYFRKQGFKPQMLTLVERKTIDKIAVPAKFPEWFDPSYVDSGGGDEVEWQRAASSERLKAMAKAWLDRSDPVASALIGDVPAKLAKTGDIVNYHDFIAHCNANHSAPRPVGAYEPGGYLGPSKVDTVKKRKVYTEAEKAEFLKDAMRVGGEINGMKLSDEARERPQE